MNKRIYIDINNEVGKRSNIIKDIIPSSLEDLINEHRRVGIDLCLVYSAKSKPYSVVRGNREILEINEREDYVLPLITLYPGMEYDIDLDSYFEKLNDNVSGIKLDLSKLFVFKPSLFEKIFSYAEKNKIPVLVDWDDIEDKEKFFELVKSYNLDVVVTNVNWSFKKYMFEYMKDNPRVHVGINGFICHGMIEEVCKRFSSERLLFSSGYPYYDIGSVKTMVEYADISEEEKDNIAYRNAQRLFKIKGVKKLDYALSDVIAESIDNGLQLDKEVGFDVIDVHTHFVSDDASTVDWIGGYKSIGALIKSSEKLGISKIMTSPMDGLLFDGIVGNQVMDEVMDTNSYPIYGYVTCNPYYQEDIDLALRKIHDDRYVGVKLYPSKNFYPYDGELYRPVLEEAAKLGKYFLLHGRVDEAERVLKKYPELLVLLAHTTQSYDFMDQAIELQERYPNLYIDICNRYTTNKALEYLVEHGDSSRILFGSDSNLLSQPNHLGWVAYSDISYDDKKKILSDNAKRLVKRSGKEL